MIFLLILATVRPTTIQLSTTQSFQLKESGNLQCWKASFSRSDPIVISRGNRCALLSSGNPANWFNVYRQTHDWRHLIPSHTTIHVVPCHTLSHSRCFGPGGSVLKNTSTRRLLDIDSSWSLAGQGEVVPEQGRAFGQTVHGYNLGVLIEDTMKIHEDTSSRDDPYRTIFNVNHSPPTSLQFDHYTTAVLARTNLVDFYGFLALTSRTNRLVLIICICRISDRRLIHPAARRCPIRTDTCIRFSWTGWSLTFTEFHRYFTKSQVNSEIAPPKYLPMKGWLLLCFLATHAPTFPPPKINIPGSHEIEDIQLRKGAQDRCRSSWQDTDSNLLTWQG